MGLSERKVKQRIGNDPRNLTWADNAAKFGHAYLSKLGWNSSMGLGVSGEGRTSHIAVAQKLNMLGIGADPASGPDAIAWKQSKDYEGVLERLNQLRGETEQTNDSSDVTVEDKEEANKITERKSKEDRKGKRKVEDPQGTLSTSTEATACTSTGTPDSESSSTTPKPRRMAHRAKFHASKRLAKSSPAALAEVLGHSASGSPAPTATLPTSGALTPINDNPVQDENAIKTSTTSVGDYFKQKMQSKLGQKSISIPSSSPLASSPPIPSEDEIHPRIGIGANASIHRHRIGLTQSSGLQSLATSDSGEASTEETDPPIVITKMKSKKKSKRNRTSDEDNTPQPIGETTGAAKKEKKRKVEEAVNDNHDQIVTLERKKRRRKEDFE